MKCKTDSKKHCMACDYVGYCDKANLCSGECHLCDDSTCENNNKFKEKPIMLREEQRQEALERMKILKLHGNAIKEFKFDGGVNLSEAYGILYWLDDEQQEYVKTFETKYNAVVYHVIRSFTEFGELLSFLYVSSEKDEWDYDKDDLKSGYPCVYVKNLDDDICSEFGSIAITPSFGGIVRTA